MLAAEGLHKHLVDHVHTVVQLVAKNTRNNTVGKSTDKHKIILAENSCLPTGIVRTDKFES